MEERLTFNPGLPAPARARERATARGGGNAESAGVRQEFADRRQPVERSRFDGAYVGMIAFTALLFFRPQDQVPALASLHLSELAAVGGLGALAFSRLSRHEPITRFTPELVGILALGAVILGTVPFSFWPGGSVSMFLDLYVKVMLIFLLMVNTLTSPRRIEQLLWLIVVASGYIAARAVVDYARGVNLVEGHRVRGPVGGMFKNPNDLALNMVAFLPAALFIALEHPRLVRRAAAAAIGILMFAAIVFTKSRSGFLGLVAMLAAVGFVLLRRRPAALGAGVAIALLSLPMLPDSFWLRMTSIVEEEHDETGSREARKDLMEHAVNVFLAHPLTGVGAGQFQNYAPPGQPPTWRVTHNALLQVASELGLFGLLVFLFLIGRAFFSVVAAERALRPRPPTLGIAGRRRAAASRPHEAAGGGTARGGVAADRGAVDRRILAALTPAVMAGLVGWFVCAQFASVAFNWTFYYLLALAAALHGVAQTRRDAAAAATRKAVGA